MIKFKLIKHCLIFIFCFVFSSVYSQDPVITINKKFKQGTLPKSFRTLSFVDKKSGEIHLTLVDNKTIERYIIDSNWKVTDQFSSERGVYSKFAYDRFKNIRMFGNKGKEYNIYVENQGFDINEIDFNTKTETAISKIEIEKNEPVISYFVTPGNAFCLITGDRKSNSLHFITNATKGGISFDTLDVKLKLPGRDTSATDNMDRVAIIKLGAYTLERLAAINKIYYSGNTVYISNDRDDATYITEVNLETGNVTRKIFPQTIIENRSALRKNAFNSFLYNNILVNGNASDAGVSVSFYDYEHENLIRKYAVDPGNITDLKNGPLLDKRNKEMRSLDDFFEDAENGIVFTLDNKGEDQLELVLKTYREETYVPGGEMNGLVGIALVNIIFANSDRAIHTFYLGEHFKSLLQPTTFDHLNTEYPEPKSASELIDTELENMDDNNVTTTFIKDHILYLGSYDPHTQNYTIKKISPLIEK